MLMRILLQNVNSNVSDSDRGTPGKSVVHRLTYKGKNNEVHMTMHEIRDCFCVKESFFDCRELLQVTYATS